MNFSRNSKKRALEKLSTIKNTKNTLNNQEIASSNDPNDILINTDVSQSKNAKNTNNTNNRQSKTTKGTKCCYAT